MQEFSKSFGGLDTNELEKVKSKISEDIQIEKDEDENETEDPDHDEFLNMPRSASVYTPNIKNQLTTDPNNILDKTLDLNDDFLTPQRKLTNISPISTDQPVFEEYVQRLD